MFNRRIGMKIKKDNGMIFICEQHLFNLAENRHRIFTT